MVPSFRKGSPDWLAEAAKRRKNHREFAMPALRLRTIALALAGSAALAGCSAYGGGYGLSSAYGYGGGYYDDYYGGGYYPSSYYGWYGNYYYPGTGYYVYDRGGRRHAWNDGQRR